MTAVIITALIIFLGPNDPAFAIGVLLIAFAIGVF